MFVQVPNHLEKVPGLTDLHCSSRNSVYLSTCKALLKTARNKRFLPLGVQALLQCGMQTLPKVVGSLDFAPISD